MAMVIVRLANEGRKKFTGKYGGVKTVINPGEEVMVPIEAGILWCGDPDTRDIDKQNKNRSFEYERIASRYGTLGNDELFHQARPRIGMFLQDGTRLNTILDDPFNDNQAELQLGGEIPRTDDQAGLRAEAGLNKVLSLLENAGIDIEALMAGELEAPADDDTDDEDEDLDDDDSDDSGVTTTTSNVTKKVATSTAKKTAAAKKAAARPSVGAQRPSAPGPRTDGQ